MLRLDLTRADTEPLEFREQPVLPAETGGEDVVSVVGLTIRGVVERMGRGYRVAGNVSGRASLRCGRCLTEFPFEFEEPFDVSLVPSTAAPREEETRLGKDELDVRFFAEPILDLGELAGEQFALAMPMKALCRGECRGLCPRCGADLNQGACGCPEESDERWAPLLEWRSREQ